MLKLKLNPLLSACCPSCSEEALGSAVVVEGGRASVANGALSLTLVDHWYNSRGFSTRPLNVRVPMLEELLRSDTR